MTDSARARVLLRVAVAFLLAAHGWYRMLTGGYTGFGEYLTSQHVPLGPVVAVLITAFEVLATPLLALGWRVRMLTPMFSVIYATGLVMVHSPEGWFVVGGGRNGMEYAVLLLVCLATLWLMHPPESARDAVIETRR